MSNRDWVYVEGVEVVEVTKAALKVLVDTSPVWIPKSQLHSDCDLYDEGDEGDLIIPRWLADEKEIEPDGEYGDD